MCKGNLVDNLTHFQVEVNNRKVNSLNKLRQIKALILESSSSHFMQVKKFDFEKQKRMYLFQMCYQFKNFFEHLGLNWKPSRQMLDQVKNKKLTKYIDDNDTDFTLAENKELMGVNYIKKIY
jgi:hypothetical protein